MNTHKVFACEFEPVAAEGLRAVLACWPEFCFAGSCASVSETLAVARLNAPDVVLFDASAGRTEMGEFLRRLNEACPGSRAVLWVDDSANGESLRALSAGARGVIRRTSGLDDLRDCLRSVAEGRVWCEEHVAEPEARRRAAPRFTAREKEILEGVLRGWKNREVAEALNITTGTVKVHLLHIYEKTGVRDRLELAARGRALLAHGGEN